MDYYMRKLLRQEATIKHKSADIFLLNPESCLLSPRIRRMRSYQAQHPDRRASY